MSDIPKKKRGRPKVVYTPRPCKDCGKPFVHRKPKRLFCSKACASRFRGFPEISPEKERERIAKVSAYCRTEEHISMLHEVGYKYMKSFREPIDPIFPSDDDTF